MPFAEDIRKYMFPSLEKLKNKSGDLLTKHPNRPTDEMASAMDAFVDSMDLMKAGPKDDNGLVPAIVHISFCAFIYWLLWLRKRTGSMVQPPRFL